MELDRIFRSMLFHHCRSEFTLQTPATPALPLRHKTCSHRPAPCFFSIKHPTPKVSTNCISPAFCELFGVFGNRWVFWGLSEIWASLLYHISVLTMCWDLLQVSIKFLTFGVIQASDHGCIEVMTEMSFSYCFS